MTTRHAPNDLALWQLNLLRVSYGFMGIGLAITRWPLFFHHGTWELKQGTVECMLLALSFLALLGLRYPRKMIPVLIFEVTWKLAWLGVVALPLWLDGTLTGAAAEQAAAVLFVVIPIAALPWRSVLRQYVLTPGDPWRRPR